MNVSASDQETLVQQMAADPQGTQITIATIPRIGRMRHDSLDILIWAGGGESSPGLPTTLLSAWPENARPLLLVDFCDYFDKVARGWSVKRSEGYRSAEIYPVGTNQNEGRLQDFERRQKKLRRFST
jgi:hypothetical protein